MSDMKCPFCQQEMRRTNGTHNKAGVWQCQNYNDPDNVCIASGYLFNDDVLNYIDRIRKALELALAELQEIDGCCEDNKYADNVYFGLDGHDTRNIALDVKKTIAQITALTKGGSNE